MKKTLLLLSFSFLLFTVVGCSNTEEDVERLESVVQANWGDKLLYERNFYQNVIATLSSDTESEGYLRGIGTNQGNFYAVNYLSNKDLLVKTIEPYYEQEMIEQIITVLEETNETSRALANHLENENLSELYQNERFINSLQSLTKEYVNGQDEEVSTNDLTLINILKYPQNISGNYPPQEVTELLGNIVSDLNLVSDSL